MNPAQLPPSPVEPEKKQPYPTADELANDPRYAQTMEGLDQDEVLVCEIHKHPFGLIVLYFMSFIGMAAATLVVFYLLPQLVSDDNQGAAQSVLSIALIVAGMFVAIGLLIATYVYRQTRLLISNKNVTQIIQRSLFSRKVSELSMSNVEDVTADQHGIIATILGYGQLRVETAGEIENFIFDYCPRPNYYGRIILAARQRYADGLRHREE